MFNFDSDSFMKNMKHTYSSKNMRKCPKGY